MINPVLLGSLVATALFGAGCAVASRPAASAVALAPTPAALAAAAPPVTATASLRTDVQPLFDNYCVACHQTGAAQQGLVLEEGLSHERIVGRPSGQAPLPLVAPGDPRKSYLLHKLKGTHLAQGGTGTAMPPDSRLDAASIAIIERWIAQGATNN